MNLLDAVTIAGICVAVAAGGLLLATQLRTASQAGRQAAHLDSAQRSERLELYMAAVWGGLLMVQTSSIFRHVELGGTMRLSTLALTSFAAVVFICGGLSGRLLLRRELRLGRGRPAEPNRAAPT